MIFPCRLLATVSMLLVCSPLASFGIKPPQFFRTMQDPAAYAQPLEDQ